MIGVIAKGKGMMVLVYALLPVSVLLFLAKLTEALIFSTSFPMEIYRALAGVAVIVSGIYCNRAAFQAQRQEQGLNQFMGMDLKSWTNIFWVIGGFMLIGTAIELLAFLH